MRAGLRQHTAVKKLSLKLTSMRVSILHSTHLARAFCFQTRKVNEDVGAGALEAFLATDRQFRPLELQSPPPPSGGQQSYGYESMTEATAALLHRLMTCM